MTKVMVWNGICGWHENCGCGHNYIHVIENSINKTTSCIIDCTDVWVMCDMQLQNNNLYCKVKKMEQKNVIYRITKEVFVCRFKDLRNFHYNHDIALITVTSTAMLLIGQLAVDGLPAPTSPNKTSPEVTPLVFGDSVHTEQYHDALFTYHPSPHQSSTHNPSTCRLSTHHPSTQTPYTHHPCTPSESTPHSTHQN